MELEQLMSKLEWLDEQRRIDKDLIATLEVRLANIENNLINTSSDLKDAVEELTPLKSIPARIEGFENVTKSVRQELLSHTDELIKQLEGAQEKYWKNERQRVNRNLSDQKKAIEPLGDLQRNLQSLSQESNRLSTSIVQLNKAFNETISSNEETLRTVKVSEENRKQDIKRLMDLQGEVSASRKRTDGIREKVDLGNEQIRHIEIRINELLASESDRKVAQTAFIEQQSQVINQRDATIREWREIYDKTIKQSEQLQNQLIEWDSVQRAVKRAQEVYEDITQKFERRINEVSEMQRLSEDRFRQEWIAFKTDDQKRWAGFTLSHEELQKENQAGSEKFNDRLTALEDLSQTLQDIFQQSREAQEDFYQGVLTQVHGLLDSYQRIMSPR